VNSDNYRTRRALLNALAVAVLLPDEIGIYFFGLRLTAARVLLLLLVPYLVARFFHANATHRYRFVFSDALVPITAAWIIIAVSEVNGVDAALNHGGPIILEFLVGYAASRFLLIEHGEALSFVNFLCRIIAIVGLLGLLDTLAHSFVLHALASSIFGSIPLTIAGVDEGGDERLGLLRAMSALEHPILFGTTCAIGLLLAVAIPMRARWFVILSCGLGAALALSSAPIQAIIMGLGLLIYDRILRRIRHRWSALIILVAFGVVLILEVLQDPLGFIFSHFVFDTQTAWFRTWIWATGVAAVAQSPWVGVGWFIPEDYGIPGTVDSIWLLWALTYGLPGSALLGLSMLGAASLPTQGRGVSLTSKEVKLGTIIGILTSLIVFLGFTVDFFGSGWILVPMLVGIRAHLGELGQSRARYSVRSKRNRVCTGVMP
jgi:hypothetical protein